MSAPVKEKINVSPQIHQFILNFPHSLNQEEEKKKLLEAKQLIERNEASLTGLEIFWILFKAEKKQQVKWAFDEIGLPLIFLKRLINSAVAVLPNKTSDEDRKELMMLEGEEIIYSAYLYSDERSNNLVSSLNYLSKYQSIKQHYSLGAKDRREEEDRKREEEDLKRLGGHFLGNLSKYSSRDLSNYFNSVKSIGLSARDLGIDNEEKAKEIGKRFDETIGEATPQDISLFLNAAQSLGLSARYLGIDNEEKAKKIGARFNETIGEATPQDISLFLNAAKSLGLSARYLGIDNEEKAKAIGKRFNEKIGEATPQDISLFLNAAQSLGLSARDLGIDNEGKAKKIGDRFIETIGGATPQEISLFYFLYLVLK